MVRNRSLLSVLALVFLIRAMVPVGFMPDFSGKHTIQICSGTELKTITVDDNGAPTSPDHQKNPCPYSFLSAAIDAPPIYTPAFETPVLIMAETSPIVQVLDTNRFHFSPPSRAPPSLIA
ncbi:MAG: hypothetical protein AUJ12_06040 [Alphaproteobacteria bacterium CG1_02_46_17]|nr:MAG: hypothetical protein AUJ12_06040 [Alphaproteobacteria bacterium CG1_02_46_17]